MSEWIKCDDRLPEDTEWAIVYADGAVNCMAYVPGRGWSDWVGAQSPNVMVSEITHWMPIPAPPK